MREEPYLEPSAPIRRPTENPHSKRVHVGVFDRIAAADRAVAELVAAGFHRNQITVICPSCTPDHFEAFKQLDPSGAHAAAGAAGGGAIGGLLGGLVALTATLATGGAGLWIAGPLLAGTGGGAVFGGLVGAMMTRGVEREVADFYDQALQKGSILVAVEWDGPAPAERLELADRIFARAAAETVELPKS
jgi:hypothetical protein